jgi:hypothetical protein
MGLSVNSTSTLMAPANMSVAVRGLMPSRNSPRSAARRNVTAQAANRLFQKSRLPAPRRDRN